MMRMRIIKYTGVEICCSEKGEQKARRKNIYCISKSVNA